MTGKALCRSTLGRWWRRSIAGAMFVLLLVPSAALGLPSAQVVIDDPAPQSGVTENATITVTGGGCLDGDEVVAAFNNEDIATATADADGSFALTFTVPPLPVGASDVEEGSEASIRVTCAGGSAVVVVAVDAATLPFTGFDLTPVTLVGGLVLAIGISLVFVSNKETKVSVPEV